MYLVIGADDCKFCEAAWKILEEAEVDASYYDIHDIENIRLKEIVVEHIQQKKVPVILKVVGGYDELFTVKMEGTL